MSKSFEPAIPSHVENGNQILSLAGVILTIGVIPNIVLQPALAQGNLPQTEAVSNTVETESEPSETQIPLPYARYYSEEIPKKEKVLDQFQTLDTVVPSQQSQEYAVKNHPLYKIYSTQNTFTGTRDIVIDLDYSDIPLQSQISPEVAEALTSLIQAQDEGIDYSFELKSIMFKLVRYFEYGTIVEYAKLAKADEGIMEIYNSLPNQNTNLDELLNNTITAEDFMNPDQAFSNILAGENLTQYILAQKVVMQLKLAEALYNFSQTPDMTIQTENGEEVINYSELAEYLVVNMSYDPNGKENHLQFLFPNNLTSNYFKDKDISPDNRALSQIASELRQAMEGQGLGQGVPEFGFKIDLGDSSLSDPAITTSLLATEQLLLKLLPELNFQTAINDLQLKIASMKKKIDENILAIPQSENYQFTEKYYQGRKRYIEIRFKQPFVDRILELAEKHQLPNFDPNTFDPEELQIIRVSDSVQGIYIVKLGDENYFILNDGELLEVIETVKYYQDVLQSGFYNGLEVGRVRFNSQLNYWEAGFNDSLDPSRFIGANWDSTSLVLVRAERASIDEPLPKNYQLFVTPKNGSDIDLQELIESIQKAKITVTKAKRTRNRIEIIDLVPLVEGLENDEIAEALGQIAQQLTLNGVVGYGTNHLTITLENKSIITLTITVASTDLTPQ